MATADELATYRARRDFTQSPEPSDAAPSSGDRRPFVIQKHAARSLHYDFRLELEGTLRSWAIPKGPSLDPAVKRMAVQVEDHPLSYAGFEGTIPPDQYGAGTVIVWDRGDWVPVGDPVAGLRDGHIKFELRGKKLTGRWSLIRMKPRARERQPTWLLVKEADAAARRSDDYDVVVAEPDSVLATSRPTRTAASPGPAKGHEGSVRSAASTASKRAAKPVSHPERVIDEESGGTKGQLADYYERVAPLMLPHLKERPVALVRAPRGVGGAQFFQKHAAADELAGVVRLDPSLDPGHEALMVIGSAEGLISAAQMNAVELHTWNMTRLTLPKPDRMVFDLDPGEGVEWVAVRECAQLLRAFLEELGLKGLVKTSGGKGLHVVVPLAPRHDWQMVRQLSEAVVSRMAETVPDQFVAKSGPRNRVGRIFIDYLRNGWGATTASAWSARARPGLGISVPIDWSELETTRSGSHWTLRNIDGRLATGNAPWGTLIAPRQTLTKAIKALDLKPTRSEA